MDAGLIAVRPWTPALCGLALALCAGWAGLYARRHAGA
jgi:hypothetical protein